MDLQRLPDTATPVLRCASPIARVDDALAIISACYEHDASRVLITEALLPAAFFELQTRFAGEFVQKLVNYRIKLAGVFAQGDEAYTERFREYIGEARQGRQFRAFEDEAAAIAWLQS